MTGADALVALALFGTVSTTIVTIARVYMRRLELQHREGPSLDGHTERRLERIEQAVDAIAVEMERVSEGQRFTTKLLSERSAAPISPSSDATSR